jgi:hypothetical protein
MMAAELEAAYPLSIHELPQYHNKLLSRSPPVAFQHDIVTGTMHSLEHFNASGYITVPTCGKADFKYYVVAPGFRNGMYLLGEMKKFVTVSEQRFVGLNENDSDIKIQLAGVPDEIVDVTVYDSEMPSVETIECYIQDNHYATLTLSRDGSSYPCM